jgi:xanthine permease
MENMRKWKIVTLGFQHVLAMYAGAVVVPLIVGPAIGMTQEQVEYLISIDLFTCGIASLIQVVGGRYFGIKLPVILGCAFQAVGPMIAIGNIQGITAIYGAIIVSGFLVIVFSNFLGAILKYFPPVVIGCVVMIIGLSLIPVAINNCAGGVGSPTFGHFENLFLALLTFVCVILMNRFAKGFMRAISVLVSMIVGTVVAYFMGLVDLKPVADAAWLRMVQPFYFGTPSFHFSAILSMTLVAIVSMIESTGVFMALADVCQKKIQPLDIKRGLRAEGLAAMLGGIFNSFPYTTFSQNVGLVALTQVKTRNVVISAGVILMVIGLLPKVAAVTTIIPTSVLGGAMIPMFGMVIASGVSILSRIDFHRIENLLIIACSVGVGLGSAVVPKLFEQLPGNIRLFFENGIVVGSITAVILNAVLNRSAIVAVETNSFEQLKEDHTSEVIL